MEIPYPPEIKENPELTAWLQVLGRLISETKDEDTMVSDSDVHLATQQSIKAYIEAGNFNARVKGWVQFNGTGTIAIQDSFNVDSITDNGTGDYTITWDTDFANNDYSVIISIGLLSENSLTGVITSMATTNVRIQCINQSINAFDASIVCVIALGDQ